MDKTLCEKCVNFWKNSYEVQGVEYEQLFCDKTPNLMMMSTINDDGEIIPNIKRCGRFESEDKKK